MSATPRLAILSDIHGNLPALQAVFSDLQRQSVDGLVVAGDTATGPQVNECADLLRSYPGWAILGNNEEYMLKFANGDAPPAWHTHRQFGLIRWSFQQLSPATLDYFFSLPSQQTIRLPGAAGIHVVHGSPDSSSESIFPISQPAGLERALAQVDEAVLVCGHIHLPWQQRRDGKLALNPGAVGGSLNGDPRAQYMLLDWDGTDWQATPRAVPYDLDKIRAIFHQSGLLEASGGFGRAYLRSVESGQEVVLPFLKYASQLAAQAGIPDSAPIPDNLWETASQTFDYHQALDPGGYCL